jgi:hypothetical protein
MIAPDRKDRRGETSGENGRGSRYCFRQVGPGKNELCVVGPEEFHFRYDGKRRDLRENGAFAVLQRPAGEAMTAIMMR